MLLSSTYEFVSVRV